jgi:L-histidine Nalpha-methyltransferase
LDVFWHSISKGHRLKITNLIEKNQSTRHHEAFGVDVLSGLSAMPKSISAKYFYDDIGSELFQQISQHPDYYLTKTEYAILQRISTTIPDIVNETEIDIIELGVGDGHKSKLIIDGFLDKSKKVNFYPIDISEKAMHLLGENIMNTDTLSIHGVIADYFHGLQHIHEISNNKKLVLFLGSNIGNFTREQSVGFLKRLWSSLDHGDYVLIGFDLIKDPDVLNQAYNDSDGLTKAFNLNLLDRINRELGGNFNTNAFQHYGFYNPTLACMESYLISLADQDVSIAISDQTFHFEKFEAMHLEYSYKFSTQLIEHLARDMGFDIEKHFADDKTFFSDSLWQVRKTK